MNHCVSFLRVGALTSHLAILTYSEAQRNKAEAVVHKMVKRAIEMEGTVTVSPPATGERCQHELTWYTQGEHGVGLVKRDYLPHELGESTVDAMRQVCYFNAAYA